MKEQSKVKIKIAFVSSSAWTMYNFRREVLQGMLQDGLEVIIIAEEDKYASLLVAMGCLFVPVYINNRSLRPTDDIRLFLRLKKIYKKYRPDFIFHYVIKPNIYGTLAAGLLHIPSVAVITGMGHAFNRNNLLLRAFIKRLYYFSLGYAYEVWCLNEEDAGFFADNKIVPYQKIKVLPGEGVNTDHFIKDTNVTKNETFTFLMSARLLKSKGILEYTNATLLLRKKGFAFRCFLLGAVENHPDAVSRQQILTWQQEHGLQYQGFTDDVRASLSEADCFVYPSYYNEGVPRSLMEACSMQLPVITTDNTGCRNLIRDGVNGFICKKKDAYSLAVKMESMLALSVDEREAMGKKGRAIIETTYAVNKVVSFYNKFLKMYFNTTNS